jgi:hypothetical protein
MEKGKKKLYFSDYFRISDSIHAGVVRFHTLTGKCIEPVIS